MTLDELKDRKTQLENAINQTTNQVYVFQGHKQEVEFQIAELEKATAEQVATPDVLPVE